MTVPMNPGEIPVDAGLVSRLIRVQFPRLASLPIVPIRAWGTDNAMFRLGDALSVRLPRRDYAAEAILKEQKWLPLLSLKLPLPIPVPIEVGEPAFGYPFSWSVCRWVEGESAVDEEALDMTAVAVQLAGVLSALRTIDTSGAPGPGAHNSFRGVPVRQRDGIVQKWLPGLEGLADTSRIARAWELARSAPDWDGPPHWMHGDLHASNIVVADRRLSGIIDFGCIGVGDPATDLIPAWSILDSSGRRTLRAEMAVDEATWLRGMGWALSMAITAWPYYLDTNPTLVAVSKRIVKEVLSEFG